MEFTQLQREPSLASRVTESMLATIASGGFAPGDWLPSERELSDQFGVSRTVIREAVRGLEAKGVVEVRSGRGARVAHVSSSRVSESLQLYLSGAQSQQLLGPHEISEVRATLELRLVELACEKATEADLDEIQASLTDMAAGGGAGRAPP
ncbi:FadR/GntR family transcriptional regulator, partial [Microbacterium sp. NPDC003461]